MRTRSPSSVCKTSPSNSRGVAALEQALLADDTPGALTANSTPTAIRTKVKVINGMGYVFAYNHTNANVTATFGWNTVPGTSTVNAEHRTVVASGSSFTDWFGPYQAHVYVLAARGTADGEHTGSASPDGTVARY